MPWRVERARQEEVEALQAAGGATQHERGREQADQPGPTAHADPPGSGRLPGSKGEVDPLAESNEDPILWLAREEGEAIGLEPVAPEEVRDSSVNCRHGRTP